MGRSDLGCVSMKLYLQKQAVDQVWYLGCGSPTPGLEYCLFLWCSGCTGESINVCKPDWVMSFLHDPGPSGAIGKGPVIRWWWWWQWWWRRRVREKRGGRRRRKKKKTSQIPLSGTSWQWQTQGHDKGDFCWTQKWVYWSPHSSWPFLLGLTGSRKDLGSIQERIAWLPWKWKLLSPVRLFATPWTVHEILWARILERVAFPFSRESSQPRDRTQVSRIAGRFFTSWATRVAWPP